MVYRGIAIDYTVTLEPVPDSGYVQLRLPGNDYTNWVPIDPSGSTIVPAPLSEPGINVITAVYTGNDTYAFSVSPPFEQEVITVPTTTTLTITPAVAEIHEPITFHVAVEPKPEMDIRVQLSGPMGPPTIIVSAETGTGEAVLPDGPHRIYLLPHGDYTYVARYPGASYTEPSEDSATLTIARVPTTTELTLAPDTVDAATTVRATATVSPPPGAGLSVQFIVDGSPGYSTESYVDEDGVAIVDLPIGEWAGGAYTVSATVQESENFASSTGTATLTMDTPPPWGSVNFENQLPYTTGQFVYVDMPATDTTRDVRHVALSNDGVDWTTFPYPEGGQDLYWKLSDGEGPKTIFGKWRDAAGQWSGPAIDTIIYDKEPPQGAVSFPAPTYVTDPDVVLNTYAEDSGSVVTHVALSNDGKTYTTLPYASSTDWLLLNGNGSRTVWAKWRDGVGRWSAPASDSVFLDTARPTVSAPKWRIVSGSPIVDAKATVRLSWSGTDTGSGIARYDVAQSTDGFAWDGVSRDLASPSIDRLLAPGHAYTFRVRAVDKAGNVGLFTTSSTFTPKTYQESSSRITFSGSWSTAKAATFWGGALKRSTTAGAKATFVFTGRSVAWVGRRGPDRGKAEVYVNGTRVATVDLYASSPLANRVVWSTSWSTSIKRTVVIRVLGTSGRPRVDVDAIVSTN